VDTLPPKLYQSIPREIRALLAQRNILANEDPKQYDDLFKVLAEFYRPTDVLQWLGIKDLQDLIWEQFRLGRIKPGIIEAAQKKALVLLLASMSNTHLLDHTREGNITRAESDANDWYADPAAREAIQKKLAKFNFSQNSIDGLAVVQRLDALMALEKMLMSIEARKFAVRRQLDDQKNILDLRRDNKNAEGLEKEPAKFSHVRPKRIAP
jgi:hypothetical protein